MRLSHLSLKNWRNFKAVDIPVADRLFIVGPNASGKSNLLDALRFLRDIAATGGGLQHALEIRGGLKRVRCLAARNFNHGHVNLEIRLTDTAHNTEWTYELSFKSEPAGTHRPIVFSEIVRRNNEIVLDRPSQEDEDDKERLTQTALEQVNTNKNFREIAEFLGGIRYLHLVPQVMRDPDMGQNGNMDPFGRNLLVRMAETKKRTLDARLKKINEALRVAVPQLQELRLVRDAAGAPHLEASYHHWRRNAVWQNEGDFSDGTLRLIGMLWMLTEGSSRTNQIILMEEPELSLHGAIVRRLPTLLSRATRHSSTQAILSTHSMEILADPGLGLDEVVILQPDKEGTTAMMAADVDGIEEHLNLDFSLHEILAQRTTPSEIEKLSLLL